MRARRLEIVILAVAALILLVLGFERKAAESASPPSVFSTYDRGPNGYAALFTVLRQAGVEVTRFERRLSQLQPEVRTLVIAEDAFDPSALGKGDAAVLRQFVRNGGRLVVLSSVFAGKRDAIPAVARSIQASQRMAIPVVANRFTGSVNRITAPIDAVLPFTERQGEPLLGNEAGIVAIGYAYGNGEVVAITAPALFGNAYLNDAGNLAFAYNVIAGHGPAAFDEYVHGYDEDAGFWAALPAPVHVAVFMAIGILLLTIAGANVPFAPPVSLEPPAERDSSAFLDAMADLMRRARARRAVVSAFAQNARRLYRRSENERVRENAAEVERLASASDVSDESLLRAAVLDYRLRAEPL